MPADHKGFERWAISDPNFPYPIGEFDVFVSDTAGAAVTCDIFLPDAIPDKQTVAERSIGITDSYKFWTALACSKDAAGAVTVEVVLTGRHVHWFESAWRRRPRARRRDSTEPGRGRRRRVAAGAGGASRPLQLVDGVLGTGRQGSRPLLPQRLPLAQFAGEFSQGRREGEAGGGHLAAPQAASSEL